MFFSMQRMNEFTFAIGNGCLKMTLERLSVHHHFSICGVRAAALQISIRFADNAIRSATDRIRAVHICICRYLPLFWLIS
jgi:hypothetical protein